MQNYLYKNDIKSIKISSNIAFRGRNKYIIGATDEELYFVWKMPKMPKRQTLKDILVNIIRA